MDILSSRVGHFNISPRLRQIRPVGESGRRVDITRESSSPNHRSLRVVPGLYSTSSTLLPCRDFPTGLHSLKWRDLETKG